MNILRTESLYALLALVCGVSLLVFLTLIGPDSLLQKHSQTATVSIGTRHVLPPDVFAHVIVEGKAAVVYDATDDVFLYTKNATAQLPLASVAKAFLALIAHETLLPNETITITPTALATEGDWGFTVGETWSMQELLNFTLIESANDGAAAIAEHIEKRTGVPIAEALNNRARALGLTETYFLNETGLDVHEEVLSGSYGSAQDVAHAFGYITETYPDLLTATTQPTADYSALDGTTFHATNTNEMIAQIPNMVGGKTGFTDLAGGNLVVAFQPEPGHYIIVVVLGSSKEGRFRDVRGLVHAVLARHNL